MANSQVAALLGYLSLEWADDEPLWLPSPEEAVKNIQSFLVVVEQQP